MKKAQAQQQPQQQQQQQLQEDPDNKRNVVQFTFEFQIMHASPKANLFNIKYTWLGPTNPDSYDIYETGQVQTWEKIEIEQPGESQEKPKNLFKFTKVFDQIYFSEKNSYQLSAFPVSFYLTGPPPEFQIEDPPVQIPGKKEVKQQQIKYEEKEYSPYSIDISQLLFYSILNITYQRNPMPELFSSFQLVITADKPLLSEYLNKKLNPLLFNLISVSELPELPPDALYENVYAEVSFFNLDVFPAGFLDEQEVQQQVPQRQPPPSQQKGSARGPQQKQPSSVQQAQPKKQQQMKMQFKTFSYSHQRYIKFEEKHVFLIGPFLERLKDCILNSPLEIVIRDKDIKGGISGHAKSYFNLRDLLKTSVKQLKNRSELLAVRRPMIDESRKLDLNEASKEQGRFIERSLKYNGAQVLIGIDLFQPLVVTFPIIYNRAIAFIPYKSETYKKILQVIESYNCKTLNLKNRRELATKQLSPQEKQQGDLDIITGFCLMDQSYRLVVVEGMKQGGMKVFQDEIIRINPNTQKYKILCNPDVEFMTRVYLDFDCDLKRIKLRDELDAILMNPSTYIRTKVSEEMFKTLQNLKELGRCERLKLAQSGNLFPSVEMLNAVERKYGESLNDYDMFGQGKQDQKNGEIQAKQLDPMETKSAREFEAIKPETKGSSRSRQRFKGATITSNREYEESRKSQRKVDAQQEYRKMLNELTQKSKSKASARNGIMQYEGDVYIYSNQKLNYREMLMKKMIQEKVNDKNNFYTYSKDYLGLSFPLVDMHEQQIEQEALSKSKWRTKNGFEGQPKKSLDEYNKHPRQLDEATLSNLQIPYHESKKEEHLLLTKIKEDPDRAKHNKNFVQFLGKKEYFGSPEEFKSVHVSGEGREKEIHTDKLKEIQDWRQKLVVQDPHFQVLHSAIKKPSQLDKLNGILKGPPQKLSIKKDYLDKERPLKIPPSSIFHEEAYKDPVDFIAALKKNQPEKNMGTDTFDRFKPPPQSIVHKMPILPLISTERAGPKWANQRKRSLS